MSEVLQLNVTGMTCGGCENAVKHALQRVKGVEEVTASHSDERVGVTFDEHVVTPLVIRETIEGLGYTVLNP